MKPRRFTLGAFAAAGLLLQPGALSIAHAAQPRETVLIDLADSRREVDGRTSHNYEYTFQDWGSGHVIDIPGRGALIKAPSGKGGFGENRTAVVFSDSPAVEVLYLVGNQNSAKSVTFALTDSDGTEVQWNVPVDGKPVGQLLRHRIELAKPDGVQKPGKNAQLNVKKVRDWQIRGDYEAANVEVLVVRLIAVK